MYVTRGACMGKYMQLMRSTAVSIIFQSHYLHAIQLHVSYMQMRCWPTVAQAGNIQEVELFYDGQLWSQYLFGALSAVLWRE